MERRSIGHSPSCWLPSSHLPATPKLPSRPALAAEGTECPKWSSKTRARPEGHHPLDAEPPPVQPWTAAMEITENRPQIIPADGSAVGGIAQRATVARRNHSRIAPPLPQPELTAPAVGRSPIAFPQIPAWPPTRVAKPVDATPHGYRPGRRCRCSRSHPPLFTVAGVAGPDLRHRDLPSLQLDVQPLLHRVGTQRDGPHRTGHHQPMQRGVGVRHPLGIATHRPIVGIDQAGQRQLQQDQHRRRITQPMHSWFLPGAQHREPVRRAPCHRPAGAASSRRTSEMPPRQNRGR